MSMFDLEEREAIESAARAWWLFLLTGLLWLLFAIIVLRFDYGTVTAVSILFGVVAIAAGINEFFMLAAAHRWWKVLHGLLGVIFVVVGLIAFVHPGDTFEAGKLGEYTVEDDNSILLGDPFVFDESNIDDFDF